MKTKQEIQDEIDELMDTNTALGEMFESLHQLQMKTLKKLYALTHMLREMEDNKPEGKTHD